MPANVCEHEASPGGVESILIVEDQDAVRNVVALMLESNGYVVHAAAHPADALRLVEQRRTYDRPATHRPRDARRQRSRAGGADPATSARHPGPVMSGYSNHATTRNGTREDGSAYLEKPFSEDPARARGPRCTRPSGSGDRGGRDWGRRAGLIGRAARVRGFDRACTHVAPEPEERLAVPGGHVERDAVGAGAPLHCEPQRRASSPAAQTLKNVLAMLPRLSLTSFVVSVSTTFE
jgi:CheY-like chemotaxis protein